MNRQFIYKQIKDTLGIVPVMFKALPNSSLDLEWQLFTKEQLEEGPIPARYRSLIGLAAAAAIGCRYCTFLNTQMAKLNGASAAEIEDAVHLAKANTGWSAYANGLQLDYEQFKSEALKVCDYVRAASAQQTEVEKNDSQSSGGGNSGQTQV